MTRHTTKRAFSFIILIFATAFLFAEIIQDNDFNFSLDIPEGYQIVDSTPDGMSYHFKHPNIPVQFIMKINTGDLYTDSPATLKTNLNKLKANFQQDQFLWNETQAAISTFTMNLDQSYAGWAVSVPTSVQNYFLTLICYAPSEKEPACEQFIMSTLNSLCINNDVYNTPGIIVSYAFPKEADKTVELNIAGKSIKTTINSVDEEASQFVVDMEYSVLTLYASHKLWKEAWQRYYRMIYRDNFARILPVCSAIISELYPVAKKQNPQNSKIAFAQMVLSWVQGFEYRRADDPKKADFTALPCVICGTGNDCDSRSMIVCAVMKTFGEECIMLISPEYSHAMAAAGIEAQGQQYELDGTDLSFIMGETTAKVTWGMIAQEHMDRSKWIPVILP